MIEARDLTKIYAGKAAVDHLTFTVEPGQVTGFLGPNGAGQVHHHAAHPGPGPAAERHRAHQRPALPGSEGSAADGRRAARGQDRASRAHGPEPPAVPGPDSGPICTIIGIVFVLPILTGLLPSSWGAHINAYLPEQAGTLITHTHEQSGDLLSPWQGFGVLCIWTVLALAVAAYLLERRDA